MKIERLALDAMGTRFELVLVDAGGQAKFLRAAGEAALEVIADCERRWSAFARDSLVARINREPGPTRVDPLTFALLAAALELWKRTGGAFDPALGAEMERAGLRGRLARDLPQGVAGPPLELDESAQTVRVRSGSRLDLGGIAKGYALDLAAEELREAGVECALLHGGTSSVVALGAPPPREAPRAAWRVAVSNPVGPGPAGPGPVGKGPGDELTARLADRSLSVSAPHGRVATSAGSERGHVLDPRTGRAAPLGSVACVVASSGLEADGLATALVANGSAGQNAAPDPATLLRSGDAAALVRGTPDSGERRWELFGDHALHFETRSPETP